MSASSRTSAPRARRSSTSSTVPPSARRRTASLRCGRTSPSSAERTCSSNRSGYFFYITNDNDLSALEVIEEARQRCNQENLIEQLKNGVRALHAPVNTLTANWAYMVMTALAWSLKAWVGMLLPIRRTLPMIGQRSFGFSIPAGGQSLAPDKR